MEPIIKIENLSKQYRLGIVGTGTLSHDLNRWYHRIRGKDDPYLKIGDERKLTTDNRQLTTDYVWALKDINLEVMPGEVLGIIGKNGRAMRAPSSIELSSVSWNFASSM